MNAAAIRRSFRRTERAWLLRGSGKRRRLFKLIISKVNNKHEASERSSTIESTGITVIKKTSYVAEIPLTTYTDTYLRKYR